jgi:magnesium transporter
MDRDQFREFVRRLDPDEVADALGLADERTRTAVLERLDEDRRERAEFPLEFSPESAAVLMHLDYATTRIGGSKRSPSESSAARTGPAGSRRYSLRRRRTSSGSSSSWGWLRP